MNEVSKSQFIRLVDVFAIGPAMIYISFNKNLSKSEKVFLSLTGALTIFYNGKNYFETQKLNRK